MPIVLFSVGSINPIEYVQTAVGAHEKYVVSSQVLHLPITLKHNQLRKNGNSLQVNGKRPQELNHAKARHSRADQMSQECEDETWNRSKFPMQERILGLVICALDRFLKLNGVHDRRRGCNVNHLHKRIVKGIKSGKKIEIASHKDDQEKFMRSDRNS